MKKRHITDLTIEELEKVFSINSQLQQTVSEDMEESELIFIKEKLDYVHDSLSCWGIGLDPQSYMTVRNCESFMEGIERMEKNTPTFTEVDREAIQKASSAVHEYMNTDIDSENFSDIRDVAEHLTQDVADLMTKRLVEDLELSLNYADQLDYFLDFYVEARMKEENYYIKEGDFTLYRDISTTLSYK